MRICLFTSTFLPKIGGHEIAMDQLALRFQQLGHPVTVLAQTASLWRRRQKLNRPYQTAWLAKPLSQQRGIASFDRALRRLHQKWPFDVVHTFSSYPTGYAALKLCAEKNIPLIVTSQGGDLANGSRYEQRPAIMQQIRETLAQCAAVTAISHYMRERALAINPACKTHLHDIPNGVDITQLSTPVSNPPALFNKYPILARKKFILFMGRLHHRKGIDVLVKAFQHAADELGEVDLLIAGSGRELQSLKALAAQKKSKRIHFLGPVSGDAKRWLLQNALCLVAPTRTWEGMPVVVLEAQACGLPVIGTNVGGIVDLVHPNQNGLLVEPEDVSGLATGLRQLVPNESKLTSLSCGARQSIQRYDWAVVAGEYLNLFNSLLTASPDSGPHQLP